MTSAEVYLETSPSGQAYWSTLLLCMRGDTSGISLDMLPKPFDSKNIFSLKKNYTSDQLGM
jgi:hypothetical protein